MSKEIDKILTTFRVNYWKLRTVTNFLQKLRIPKETLSEITHSSGSTFIGGGADTEQIYVKVYVDAPVKFK
jgi:hypothetical protein